jgi:hypothetical protein
MNEAERGEKSSEAEASRLRPQSPVLDLEATEVAPEPSPARTDTQAAPDTTISTGPGEPVRAEAESLVDDDTHAAEAEKLRPDVPPQTRAGRGTAFASGLLGAILGAAASMAALFWYGGVPARQSDRTTELARLDKLETDVRAVAARPAADPARLNELGQRTAAGEQAMRRLDAVDQQLAKIQAVVARPPAAADANETARLVTLESTAQTLTTAVNELRAQLTQVASTTQRTQEEVTRATNAPAVDLGPLQRQVEGIAGHAQSTDQSVKSLQAEVAKVGAAARGPDSDKQARLLAAAVSLRNAVERHQPFAPQLAALRALGADAGKLAPLAQLAAQGVGTDASLLGELTDRIGRRRAPEEGSTGLLDRLQHSAENLVRIRRSDAPVQPSASLSAAYTAAQRGDLAGAYAEMSKLSEAEREGLRDWMTKVQARNAAIEAVRAIEADAVARISTAEPQRP